MLNKNIKLINFKLTTNIHSFHTDAHVQQQVKNKIRKY